MPYLQSNIPHFKCWVRREYTCNHEAYHGEFLHAMDSGYNNAKQMLEFSSYLYWKRSR